MLLVALGMSTNPSSQVPLFAEYGNEAPPLRSYSVPVHIDVAIHKLFTFHFGLNGMVYYRRPGKLAMTIDRVPEKYQRAFAELGTPRTWPQTYDLEVLGKDVTSGHCVYHLRGTPLQPNDVDYMLADVPSDSGPVTAVWYLRGGGSISSTFDMAMVGGDYIMPTEQHADIDAQGFKLHADLTYGDYDINGEVSDALF